MFRVAISLALGLVVDATELRGQNVAFKHHHPAQKKSVKKAGDDDDDDDLDFSKIHFHFHTPSYGNFKMNEPSTVLHELLQKLDTNDFDKVADASIKAHDLSNPSKSKTLDELGLSLSGLHGNGPSFLLDGALADFPNMARDKARTQFIQLIEAVIKRAPAGSVKNATKVMAPPAAPKALVAHGSNSTKKATTMTYAKLGPFESLVAACEYCYQSHTRTTVVPNCICTAYTASDGPTMFCTASQPGVKYSAAKDGACLCVEKNMAKMGATTCDPHP
jgi:hypothetical protein